MPGTDKTDATKIAAELEALAASVARFEQRYEDEMKPLALALPKLGGEGVDRIEKIVEALERIAEHTAALPAIARTLDGIANRDGS